MIVKFQHHIIFWFQVVAIKVHSTEFVKNFQIKVYVRLSAECMSIEHVYEDITTLFYKIDYINLRCQLVL